MAVEEDEFDLSEDDSEGKKPGSKKKFLWIGLGVVGVLLVVGLSIGLTLMLAGGDSTDGAEGGDEVTENSAKGEESEKKESSGKTGETQYVPLKPPFVVNFASQASSTAKFLQITMEVSTRDESVVADIEKHMPVIRNNLVLLLSSQDQQEISSREGKEKLRGEVLAEIQRILKKRTGKVGVEDIYFTSFVMQ
ncbi:MAG: hypothetical protein BMS9Abin26_1249 [Gammaproteobacteria bacterium]|nr:MAG: hypothetical protein BMS9Abin26_1249 [Gammaproteobacteria bacterium]